MTISVLVVDDHQLVRAGLRKIVDDDPAMQVIAEAESGEQAIQICRDRSPDVVLMDVNMPGIGGFEATRKLVRSHQKTRVLIVTICNNPLFPSRLLHIGAAGYITKDETPEEMVKAIKSVYAGRRYISAEIANCLAMRHIQEADDSPFESLSERELQVMLMITMGVKVPHIADKLCLSPKTVNSYRYRIFEKLGVNNDVEITLMAIRNGLIDTDSLQQTVLTDSNNSAG